MSGRFITSEDWLRQMKHAEKTGAALYFHGYCAVHRGPTKKCAKKQHP